ncbi:MAG: PilN domain-containing protein [Actinobacteria bacterium]|nr:PilN domain-containing protein [Actinomycetota bacterium]
MALAVLFFNERSIVGNKKSELSTTKAHLVAQEARAQPIKDAQAANLARLGFVRTVSATRVHWDVVLGDLGRTLPAGVSLSSLTASSPVPTAPAAVGVAPAAPATPVPTAAQSFVMAGSTSSHNRVALVLDRLALLPWLSNVVLQQTTRGGDNAVQFTIGATYVGGAGT